MKNKQAGNRDKPTGKKNQQIKNKQPELKTAQIKAAATKTSQAKPETVYPVDPKSLSKLKIILGIIITLFAIILYANSVNHDYTLDDHPVVDQNRLTTNGIAGIPTILKTDYWYGHSMAELRGPVYRPTSLVVFALVWQFSPNNPHLYHLINVLFYAASCLILFPCSLPGI
jgi:hypothetical protein